MRDLKLLRLICATPPRPGGRRSRRPGPPQIVLGWTALRLEVSDAVPRVGRRAPGSRRSRSGRCRAEDMTLDRTGGAGSLTPMAVRFVIIGGGPAGNRRPRTRPALGAEVTLIERDIVGGAAHLWDCIPSKAMIATGGELAELDARRGHGLDASRADARPRRAARAHRAASRAGSSARSSACSRARACA